jgi:hypothetical protein
MNIDSLNIGSYRISNHGGFHYYLYNVANDKGYIISQDEYRNIKEHNSLEAVHFVEVDAERRKVRKELGLDVT